MAFNSHFGIFVPLLLMSFKVTRLIPDAKGTTCNQRLERISGTEHTHILRVPFRTENGILRKWISRFDVWPYLETFAEVSVAKTLVFHQFVLYLFFISVSVSLSLSLSLLLPCDNVSKMIEKLHQVGFQFNLFFLLA